MIKSITNFHDLDKEMRSLIIECSSLDGNNVLNALSVRGPDLQKQIEDANIFVSYDLSDCVAIFEISLDENSSNNVQIEQQSDGTMIQYVAFNMSLSIYGNASNLLMRFIQAQINTSYVIQKMYEKGIYIESTSNVRSTNEFVNETIWPRSDMTINFACKIEFSPNENYKEYSMINLKKIIEGGK